MSYEHIRTSLITLVSSVTPSLGMPVFHENREVPDLDKAPRVFLYVEIDFNDTSSADLKEIRHVVGVLSLELWTRAGEGVVTELSTADTLDVALSRQQPGGVLLGVMTPGRKTSKLGWRRTEWLIPFNFYS